MILTGSGDVMRISFWELFLEPAMPTRDGMSGSCETAAICRKHGLLSGPPRQSQHECWVEGSCLVGARLVLPSCLHLSFPLSSLSLKRDHVKLLSTSAEWDSKDKMIQRWSFWEEAQSWVTTGLQVRATYESGSKALLPL